MSHESFSDDEEVLSHVGKDNMEAFKHANLSIKKGKADRGNIVDLIDTIIRRKRINITCCELF